MDTAIIQIHLDTNYAQSSKRLFYLQRSLHDHYLILTYRDSSSSERTDSQKLSVTDG